MDKIRSFSTKVGLSNLTSGSSTKLSKAFKFDKQHNAMSAPRSGDPFRDGPIFEEPSIDKTHLYIHTVAGFFSFLALCTIAAVAGFQAKHVGVSGGTGFVLFLVIVAFLLTVLLTAVPIIYDRWDKLKRPAQFLAVSRSLLILHAFGTGLMLLAAFIVTISAKGCKNPEDDPHASLGDGFKDGLKQWCTTKKASAIFDWFSFAAWAALLVLSVLAFRRERRREPGFIPPSEGISYANVGDHVPASGGDDPYADKHEVSGAAPAGSTTGYESYGYTAAGREDDAAFSRPSMDAYGAFADSPGTGRPTSEVRSPDSQSRTMQLAYSDPYAQIRQSLMSPSHEYAAPTYSQTQHGAAQHLPNPPAYGGGYR